MDKRINLITAEQLKSIMPHATDENIRTYLPFLNDTMMRFEIDTNIRQCHFLAQLAVESGSLRYVRELASGEAYEGRESLGNIVPGDGVKYKGRGLIQLTGRENYQRFQDWLVLNYTEDIDVMTYPELLESPELAVMVAGWYWEMRNVNAMADRDDVVSVTRKVNGGRNGLAQRVDFLNRAKLILGWL